MTVLKKPVRRELPLEFDRSQWIAELQGWGLNLRRKRTRKVFPITWDTVIKTAILIAVEAERKERVARRKERRDASRS